MSCSARLINSSLTVFWSWHTRTVRSLAFSMRFFEPSLRDDDWRLNRYRRLMKRIAFNQIHNKISITDIKWTMTWWKMIPSIWDAFSDRHSILSPLIMLWGAWARHVVTLYVRVGYFKPLHTISYVNITSKWLIVSNTLLRSYFSSKNNELFIFLGIYIIYNF